VRVFDKARGAGGRTSTRRVDGWRFDHGAQYFTVRDRRFERWVEAWRHEGLVASWEGEIAIVDSGGSRSEARDRERFVGVPGMNAICRRLAVGMDVAFETRVSAIERCGERWRLGSEDGADLGRYDAVVVSAPAPQTADLIRRAAPGVAARAARVEMAPCWAAMVAFAGPLEPGFDGAFVHDSPLSWVARDASKPGRPDSETWVLHGAPGWSRQHLGLAREDAAQRLVDAFGDAIGVLDAAPVHLDAHRWRFAQPLEPLSELCLFDAQLRLAACGDWCGGPRVEGAFLSGRAVAERLIELHPGSGRSAHSANGR
jgi:predicted NAD/FAD-dependent oxidoreductase